ncbi:TIGR03087 family PEP-CTERM/XrtA system glycosyltransferase [Parahaliea aestuarii]|uniref:TIGR03087 family PEP-CTERM/XrtA system glycosyltransferase n=1 Tax=Parahaliea aestuarii TaxID=1852021 RepID=A0A5C8ZPL8_9GAMM|nr:TIGR03087 family PEP-CTERM/XrtA system glycosyltransferase [Parahaliea aestuarii]TXS89650.1 TIGR03087 family PEP-CTERM/XrtA system glycosyltransferase [Parahaliea aestuarii]
MTQPIPSTRRPLLLLCHRIPYPPNKGDKIRSFHLLRYLSERYEVHLGAFVDDRDDWRHAETLARYCRSYKLLPRPRIPGPLALTRCVLRAEPLTLPLYHRPAMQRWVSETVRAQGIAHAVIFSGAMGQYLTDERFDDLCRVVDFVDVDSDKWRQYAQGKTWPLSWLYRREASTLEAFERRLHCQSQASLFVSSAEAALFRERVAIYPERVDHVNNGVDHTYFDPSEAFPNPFEPGASALVFTGAMDYWPNIDAVNWFAREVLPQLRARRAGLQFHIVGSNPAAAVQKLADLPGVVVTGRVEDVRPYLQHCLAAVAPLRVARGVQNKVLEAMAMARPVLVSGAGLEGIAAVDGREVLLADDAQGYCDQLAALVDGDCAGLGAAARQRVLADFTWGASLPRIDRWIEASRHSDRLADCG